MNPYTDGAGDPVATHFNRGSPRHDHLFDGTLMRAKEKLANRMVSELFPAGRDWAQLERGELMLGEDRGSRAQDRAVKTLQARVFRAIHASNFYLSAHMMAREAVTVGTGIMKVGLSPDSDTLIEFEACTQGQVALEGGPRGQVWGYFRKQELDLERIRALWPQAGNLPQERAAPNNEPTKWKVTDTTTFDPDDGLWHYTVLVLDGSAGSARQGYREVFYRTYAVCPWVVYRYSLRPGEVQGRGPVFECLPDARTANKAVRTRLESASIRVNGMFTYRSDSVFNPRTARLRSGAFLQVGSNDTQNPTIRPLEPPGDPSLGEIILEDTRQVIREGCLDMALPPATGAVRSATEIIQRQREVMQALGTPYLRMVEEVARPVLSAVAFLLAEARQLPEVAPFLPSAADGTPAPLKLDGTDVSVAFTGPMVQAQRLDDAANIVQWGESVNRVFGPQALLTGAKPEEAVAVLGEKFGVPPEVVRSEQERAEAAQAAQQAMIEANAPAAGPMEGAA